MPRPPQALAEELEREFGLPKEEAELYVGSLRQGRIVPGSKEAKKSAESLVARGMVIVDGEGDAYRPVHPRLAVSNLFRAYEETLVRRRKEKRLLADRLTLELIPLQQQPQETESKGTNHGGAGGARGVRRG